MDEVIFVFLWKKLYIYLCCLKIDLANLFFFKAKSHRVENILYTSAHLGFRAYCAAWKLDVLFFCFNAKVFCCMDSHATTQTMNVFPSILYCAAVIMQCKYHYYCYLQYYIENIKSFIYNMSVWGGISENYISNT